MPPSSLSTGFSSERNQLSGLLRTMRPRQWAKSLIVYAAIVFDGKLFRLDLFVQTTLIFLAFCLISSSVYIVNDLADREKDRRHPRKRMRPLASGQLAPRVAWVAAGLLALAALAIAFWLHFWAGWILLLYLVQNLLFGVNSVGYVVESVHGAGPPAAQKSTMYRLVDFESKKNFAKDIAGIK